MDTSLTPIARAIRKLGGPTKTANAVGVSGTTVHDWRSRGYVPKREHALKLAALTGISPAALMALTLTGNGGGGNGKRSSDSPCMGVEPGSIVATENAIPLTPVGVLKDAA